MIGVLFYHCYGLFVIAEKHRKKILKKGGRMRDLMHINEHLAGVVLMTFSGLLLLAGLLSGFIDEFIRGIGIQEELYHFLSASFGVHVLANIWYVSHLKKEEKGYFDKK